MLFRLRYCFSSCWRCAIIDAEDADYAALFGDIALMMPRARFTAMLITAMLLR